MKSIIKRVVATLFAPYEVRVHWGELRAVHYAWSEDEARAWMRCYPPGSVAVAGNLVNGALMARR